MMRLAIRLTIGLWITSAALVAGTAVMGTGTTPGATLLFFSNRERNYQMYVADGTSGILYAAGYYPHFQGFPAWSHDGQKMAFDRERGGNRDIYVADSDGRNL